MTTASHCRGVKPAAPKSLVFAANVTYRMSFAALRSYQELRGVKKVITRLLSDNKFQ